MPDEIPIPARVEPNGPPGEAMVTEPRLKTEVIRKVDGGKITNAKDGQQNGDAQSPQSYQNLS
jgi:hypothetical protein